MGTCSTCLNDDKIDLNLEIEKEKKRNRKSIPSNSNFSANIGLSDRKLIVPDKTNLSEKELAQEIFTKINLIRTDPSKFADKLSKYIDYVKTTKTNSFIQINDRIIELKEGTKSIQDCVDYLKDKEPIQRLAQDDALVLNIPNIKCNDATYIKDTYEKKKNELKSKYPKLSFQEDVNIFNEEICIIDQLIDDNDINHNRRNNLLNQKFNYIGINCVKENNQMHCFILLGELSKELEDEI